MIMEFTERVEIQEENTIKEIQIEEDVSSKEIEIQNDFSMKETDIQDGYFHDYNDNKMQDEKMETEKNKIYKKHKLIRQLSDNISQNAKILWTTVKPYSNMEQNKRNKVKDQIVNLKRDLGAIICQQRTKLLVKLQKDQYSECSYMIPDEKTENENTRITFTNELYDFKVAE